MIKTLAILLTTLIFLVGCAPFGSDKNARKLVADGLTPKEIYTLAEKKIKAGSIDQAIAQYEVILVSYPGSKYAIQARLDIAYNLYKRKKYDRALLELEKFIEKYPLLPSTPYAYYLRGVIAEDKSSSILDGFVTDNAQRDVKSVGDAYGYYLVLIEMFPESKYSEDALSKLTPLKNILARHEFYVALYYTSIESYIASINRSKYIIENYQGSSIVADALHLMANNYDQINAEKLAQDARKVLISSYPNYSQNYSID
jgi:outer membrane protein assembly factor BamD